MENSKHTPAPWNIDHSQTFQDFTTKGWHFNIDNTDGSHIVATIHAKDKEEALANAKLVSSAPELLEALQSIVAYEERGRVSGDPRISDHWFNICTKAIKKATE